MRRDLKFIPENFQEKEGGREEGRKKVPGGHQLEATRVENSFKQGKSSR
jgi:hypothetical protein